MTTIADGIELRDPEPGDHQYFVARLDEWWGGRSMAAMLPRLFFDHFPTTTVVAVDRESGHRIGFLCGFLSQADEDTAYIHFVGIDPDHRRRGLGRHLYGWFFAIVGGLGRRTVSCVTSPVNERSIAFHHGMGFESRIVENYDGRGEDRAVFTLHLA